MDYLDFIELEEYSKSYLLEKFNNNREVLYNLLEMDLLKITDNFYKFKFVGVIIIDDWIIRCYPKYFINTENRKEDFKEIIKVIKKYDRLNNDFLNYNNQIGDFSFNLLSMMLFFIEDYYENGVYAKFQNVLEINGDGEIDWDKTVNNTFPLIHNNKPYYFDFYTKNNVFDNSDFFKLLHECIITESSNFLEKYGLLDLFELTPVDLIEISLDDFGEDEYILNKLDKELNIEFNTHKQFLLKAMKSYIDKKKSFIDEDYLTLYGTLNYNIIWEDICKRVLNDKSEYSLKSLEIDQFLDFDNDTKLKQIIERPIWDLKTVQSPIAKNTLIPDILVFHDNCFIILDAKYYDLKLDINELEGQPGLGSIIKQYLYELAFKEFMHSQNLKVQNAFLFPLDHKENIINEGHIYFKIFSEFNLENIQVILVSASMMNKYYLNMEQIDISMLKLKKIN